MPGIPSHSSKIRFAIVGCGHIGKRHAAVISINSACELVAICDVRPFEELGISTNNLPYFSSIESLLSSNVNFDVLTIATPTGLHAQHALMGLQHGHHVVIEKPMALRKKDCEEIISLAGKKQKEVFCVMQNRYSPPVKWLKEIVSDGILGNIFMLQMNCFWNRNESYYKQSDWRGSKALDGGTLFTQFSHFIDILYWIFGDIQNPSLRIENFNHKSLVDFEDSGIVSFELKQGGLGSINFSTSAWQENFESSITILAEHGTVKIGGQYMDRLEVCRIKDYQNPILEPVNPPNNYGSYKGSAANHEYIYQNVVEVLTAGGSITTNAQEGMKVVEIIQKFYESHSRK